MRARRPALDWFAFGLLAGSAAVLIAAFPQEIRLDQGFIRYVFSFSRYPGPDSGIVSLLVAGLYNQLVAPSEALLNAHFKILAMLAYAGGAFLLLRTTLRSRALVAAGLALLFVSRLPYLWLSSELFAGASLCLAVCAVVRRWRAPVTALCLVLCGMTKPDLMLIAAALLAYHAWTAPARREGARAAAYFACFAFALLAPGLLAPERFSAGGRALESIRQHYAALVHRHQAALPAPDPWLRPEAYFDASFPGTRTYFGLLSGHASRYLDFLALSTAQGLRNLIRLLQTLALLIPLRFVLARGRVLPASRAEKAMAVTLLGFAPLVLFSFPHVRYLARFYPLFLAMALGAAERVLAWPRSRRRSLVLGIGAAIFAAGISGQAWVLARDLGGIGTATQFWFPD